MLKQLFSNKTETYQSFQYPDFRNFIAARVLMTLAVQIQNVTLYWQVFKITKNALSLGMIGLSEAIPSLAVALYAGHLADKMDRRKIVVNSTFLFLLTSIALLFLSTDLASGLLSNHVYPIFIVVFLSGIARGFFRPANFALMSQLVPRELYASSAAWNSSFWQGAMVGGSALGGVIIAYLGIQNSYLIAAFLVAFGLLLTYRIKPKPAPIHVHNQSLKESLSMGVKFVFSNQIFLGAMTLDLIAVLFGGAVALLSVFAQEILMVGPVEFGILNAAPSVGAILAATYLAYKPPLKKAGINLLISVAGFGACMIVFGLSTHFYLSLLMLALSGMFDSVSVVIRSSIMQLLTPENMRGRVSAVNTMFIGSSNEIGAFESGAAAKLLGVVPSVVMGGSIAVLSALTAAKIAPKLRVLNLEN
jgi:MFS family permease